MWWWFSYFRLYRGTLRMLLVLLHDFSEFLCDYHYGLCDFIPPNCIQMRNLILSWNMRLPDPFTPKLKVMYYSLKFCNIHWNSLLNSTLQVDMLPEISIAPRMVTNFTALIKPSFKKDLDSYLKNRAPGAPHLLPVWAEDQPADHQQQHCGCWDEIQHLHDQCSRHVSITLQSSLY